MTLPHAGGRATDRHPDAAAGALRRELSRKVLHLSSAVIPVAYALGAPRGALLLLLASLLTIAVVVEIARRASGAVRRSFVRLVGPLLREHEHRGISGATWMLLGFTGAVWLAPAPVAVAATWAVAAGDASAAIVGRTLSERFAVRSRRAGRSARDPRRKSWWGSGACAGITALGAFALAGLTPVWAAAAGLVAAAAERPAGPLDDNLRIVLAVCVVLILGGKLAA